MDPKIIDDLARRMSEAVPKLRSDASKTLPGSANDRRTLVCAGRTKPRKKLSRR